MRTPFAFFFLYLLFIIQTVFLPVGPHLLLLAVIVFALYEGQIIATLLGTFAGICLDFTSPTTFGIYAFTLSLIGYGVAKLHNLFYRNFWNVTLFTIVAIGLNLAFQTVAGAISGRQLIADSRLLISTGLTLLLSPFAEPLIRRLFYTANGRQPRAGNRG
ncbi:MAG: rod shape-determining protein MreD [candidate division WOR-3 bacterium]